MPEDLPVPERVSRVTAREVAQLCVRETKADQLCEHATSLALIGLASCGADGKPSRKAMRAAYIAEHRPGFVITMIVLPLAISLVSQWIIRWWFGHSHNAPAIQRDAIGQLPERTHSELLKASATST